MPSEIETGSGIKIEQESLLPELLHALSQPLTSLRCSLEVTLLQPRDSEEYRDRLRESLKLTEDISVLARGIRELMDVEQAVSAPTPVPLDRVLRSSVREFLPLADTQGIALSLLCEPCLKVAGNEQQFFTAALYFLTFLLNFVSKGEEVNVQASSSSKGVVVLFEACKRKMPKLANDSNAREGPQTASAYLNLLVARRIFEMAGGSVRIERDPERISVHAWLPLALSAPQDISRLRAQEESNSTLLRTKRA